MASGRIIVVVVDIVGSARDGTCIASAPVVVLRIHAGRVVSIDLVGRIIV